MAAVRTLVLAAVLLLAACDRHPLGAAALVGEWRVVYSADGHASTEQRLTFGPDGSFRSAVRWYGHYNHPPTRLTGYLFTDGTYRLEDDRLLLRTARQEEWQMYAVGPNPSVIVARNPAWEERGTLQIRGRRLHHTYVSAPRDLPEEFTEVYERVR